MTLTDLLYLTAIVFFIANTIFLVIFVAAGFWLYRKIKHVGKLLPATAITSLLTATVTKKPFLSITPMILFVLRKLWPAQPRSKSR